MSRGPARRSSRKERPDSAAPSRPSRAPSRRPRHAWRLLAVGAVLLLVLAGVGPAIWQGVQQAAGPVAPTPVPTIDPRLILRPRNLPVAATLSRGVRLSGTLYPAYPGRNMLQVMVSEGSRVLPAQGAIAVVATMPGMVMRPVRGTLAARAGRYAGVLTLPMLGTYVARVAVNTPSGPATGTLTLRLFIPGL